MDRSALFAQTRRPDPALFYHRDDPHDIRLGEAVHNKPEYYAAAEVVLLGCPQDEGVRRNRGRPGAALAPAEIRRCLYRLSVYGLEGLPIFDLGDTLVEGSLEEIHTRHEAIVAELLADGKRLIVLGGGNDIAYPDCAALSRAVGSPLTFNIDAHLDVRADQPRNSGTPYRQLLDEGHLTPDTFYEIGAQPFALAAAHLRYLYERGATVITLEQARAEGLAGLVGAILARQRRPAIFWGFDMDVVRSSDAPGVSAPNPLGLSADEFCMLAALAGADPRTRLIEISEVNPAFDLDLRTCRLAAVAVYAALAAMSQGLVAP